MAALGKPPVVEVWLSLFVEPAPEGQPWNHGTAHEFAKKLTGWDQAEIEISREVQVAELEQGIPQIVGERHILDRVKLFDEERTRCVQYSQLEIIYNSLRSGSEYPGYEEVYGSAETSFCSFLEFFRPLRIHQATLCYIDIIHLPVGEQGTVELQDFLKMGVDLKEDLFGPMASYEFRSSFNCPVDKGPLMLTLRSLPGQAGDTHVRLWMEWQKACVEFDTLDLSVVKQRLDTSKQHLSKCFQESFTEMGWQLFDPEDRMD